MTLLIGSFDP